MAKYQHTNDKTKNRATAGIIISWATFWVFLLSPIGIIAWIVILIYLVVKKSQLKWYLVLSAWLFVPGCSFLTGSLRYFTGTACLRDVGGPRTFYGIDRDTKVVSTSSGCIFVGFEPFVFPPNNAAVKLCTTLFGYQRGSYKGAFPTAEEAQEIIKSADTVHIHASIIFYSLKYGNELLRLIP